jgi:hypothetical protein
MLRTNSVSIVVVLEDVIEGQRAFVQGDALNSFTLVHSRLIMRSPRNTVFEFARFIKDGRAVAAETVKESGAQPQ